MRRMIIALRLIFHRKRLERVRRKLAELYLKNEPNDSRKMCKARSRFNRLCDQWNRLERLYDEDGK